MSDALNSIHSLFLHLSLACEKKEKKNRFFDLIFFE